MEGSITVIMMNIIKKIKLYHALIIFLILILLYEPFINVMSYINIITSPINDNANTELTLLKEENSYLKEELANLTNLEPFAEYNYSLTRLSYQELYNDKVITIIGGKDKDYKQGNVLINDKGVVGVIKDVSEHTSIVNLLFALNNFSVKINDAYGTISDYQDGYLIVKNISNYESVALNDEVYTSSLGQIHESLYVGYVYKILDHDFSKEIYIKSDVDYNNLNYMYVVGE